MPEFPGRLRSPRLAAAPATPAKGEMYFDTVGNVLYWYNGTAWVSATGGAPSGAAGGDLSGTYPNPTVVKSAGNFAAGGNIGAGRTPLAGGGRVQLPVGGTTSADGINFGDEAWLYLMGSATLKLNGSIEFTGGIDANGSTINNVDVPIADGDAANKAYVDANAGGPAGDSTLTFYRGKLNLGTAKTIPGTSAWTNVDGWTETYDLPNNDQGLTTGFTVQKTGLYALTAQAEWSVGSVTGMRGIRFARNGALTGVDGQVLEPASNSASLPLRQSAHMRAVLTAGDVITLQAWSNSAVNQDIGISYTWMAWERLDAMADVAGPVSPKRAYYVGVNNAVPSGSAYQLLDAGTVQQDTIGSVSNGNTFTVPAGEAGRYRCTLWVQGKAQAVGTINGSQMLRNGIVYSDMARFSHAQVASYPSSDASIDIALVVGDVIEFQLNQSDTVAKSVGWRVTIEKIENVPGPKGDPGSTEYALQTASGASTSAATGVWTRLPQGALSTQSADAATCFRWNADGTITILQNGWYNIYASIACVGATTAGIQWGVWRDNTDTTPANPSASFRRELPAETFFVDALSHTFYYPAGYRFGVSLFNRGTATTFTAFVAIARLASGPAGPQGVEGPEGGSMAYPVYDETNLPISEASGTVACFVYTPTSSVYLVRKSATGAIWHVFGQAPMLDTGQLSPTALVSGTGWRKTNVSLTIPMSGQYLLSGTAEPIYNAAESVGGIGLAAQNAADTATPNIVYATQGQAANFRNALNVGPTRHTAVLGTNDIISIRANSNAAATIQFARGRIWAVPLYLDGVV